MAENFPQLMDDFRLTDTNIGDANLEKMLYSEFLLFPDGFTRQTKKSVKKEVIATPPRLGREKFLTSSTDRMSRPIVAVVDHMPKRGKPGRPMEHNWPGALAATKAYVKSNGLPAIKARLIEFVQEWFLKNEGKRVPDRKEIRKQVVARFY